MRDKPSWLKKRKLLRELPVSTIDEDFRLRVQAVQAIDEMIGSSGRRSPPGAARRTRTSSSRPTTGCTWASTGSPPGKQTAFETDIHVPLVVTGPNVPHGWRLPQITSTIDLYPTFAQLAGASVPGAIDGRSLKPLLAGQTASPWRQAVLVEHHGPDVTRDDPDFPGPFGGILPPTRHSVRAPVPMSNTRTARTEYYNLRKDPYELPTRPRACHFLPAATCMQSSWRSRSAAGSSAAGRPPKRASLQPWRSRARGCARRPSCLRRWTSSTPPFGTTGLEFVAGAGGPFYHFAFLVPGDRFDAAFDWAQARYRPISAPGRRARVRLLLLERARLLLRRPRRQHRRVDRASRPGGERPLRPVQRR